MTRLLVALALTFWALPASAEPVQVFVEDLKVELDGWDARKAEALGKALAADLQGAIVKNPAYRPMTYENLESQLRKEKRAEQLSCSASDQSCIQKILDNYGCEERLYGTVRQVGEQAQVNLTRYRNEQLVEGGATSAYTKAMPADITSVATRLARELFGLAGGGVATTFGGGTVKQGVSIDKGESIVNVLTDDTGFLTVTSTPSGASLSLNGKEVGTTPKTLEPMVGHYVLTADLGRLYHPAQQTVDLTTAGAEVTLTLTPAFGTLEITSEPSGAEVWLEGEKVGLTPYTSAQKPSGTYELRVVRENYLSWKGSVAVSDGKATRQPVTLDANFGALEVSTEPAGAAITLDGQPTGQATPHTFDVLQPGVHTVTLTLEGYGDAVERATVQTGALARVMAALQAKLGMLSVVAVYDDGSSCRGAVTVDGKPFGTTPVKAQVTATEHEVTVTCEEGERTEKVRVEHNQRTSLDWKIAKAGGAAGGMVQVPAGEFWMGCNPATDTECQDDEKPGRKVTLDAYRIDVHEVTVADYAACVKAGRCSEQGMKMPYRGSRALPDWAWACNWSKPGREQHPVNCLDWSQAKAFCEWAGKRLPTEAEWEKAARGTDGRKYAWGNAGFASAGKVANIVDEAAKRQQSGWPAAEDYDDGHYGTAPVGSFPAGESPYGALDMIGNVWEWVADVYDSRAYGKLSTRNPRSEVGSAWRVVRGGSWDGLAETARAAFRNSGLPTLRVVGFGVRCAQ